MVELSIREISADQRADAARIWQSLEHAHGTGALTTSWLWNEIWLESYGDLVPHVFLVAEQQGEPCGIVLITQGVQQKRGPLPVRTIHLGTAGEPPGMSVVAEYVRLLVSEPLRASFARSILRHVRSSSFSLRRTGLMPWTAWEEFVLNGMVPEDAAPFLAEPGYWFHRNEICRIRSSESVKQAKGDVLTALSKRTRGNIRRTMRHFDSIELEIPSTLEEATEMYEQLIELHQKHWQARGEPGAFAHRRFVEFHRTFIERQFPVGGVVLTRLRGNGEVLAVNYAMVEQNRLLDYQAGIADPGDSKLSIGMTLIALTMQHCFDNGIEAYDLLYGDSMYKKLMTDTTGTLTYAVYSKRTPKQFLLRKARERRFAALKEDESPEQESSP